MIKTSRAGLRTFRLSCVFLTLLLIGSARTNAQQLMVHPTRLVFEGSVRSTQVQLFNRGKEDATFRVSVIRMRMNEQGGFERITEGLPGEQFADELIRFSPRQVTIPAGGAQTVRVQLRKPAVLASGEYRSHLLFQALPPEAEKKKSSDEGLSVTLRPIVSITIPLIVLHGETSATAAIDQIDFSPPSAKAAQPLVSFDIVRGGNRSIYGDITISRKSGRSLQTIGEMKGVAIYSPNLRRSFSVPIGGPTDGEVSIAFRERREKGAVSVSVPIIR